MVYVDRTAHIRDVEALGDVLVFLRPRRFGKSLWLQTLANYYDVRRADEFDELFGGLAAGQRPPASRYFILQWNLSKVDASGSVEQISESIREHVSSQAKTFEAHYGDRLPGRVEVEGSSAAVLDSILRVVEKTPHKLYLLIDEYDNFINEVMVKDVDVYRGLVDADGPFKQVFKSVKAATEGQGLERVFVTGVSPVALNDITSGFNNAINVSLDPALAALCGFREYEIRGLLERIGTERGLSAEALEAALDTMRTWYNGYLFTRPSPGTGTADQVEPVYNPTNVLYFLMHLARWGTPPEQLYDENLRTDRGKLNFLARTSAGAGVVEKLTEGDGTVAIPRLAASFSLDNLTARLQKDRSAVASLLYYMGLLTLVRDVPLRLKIPNLVVKKLFLDRLLEIFLPDLADSSVAREIAMTFYRDGELGPLLGFFESRLLPVLSNRDRGAAAKESWQSGSGMNEMVVKTLFLSLLFDDTRYVTFSELELSQGYADLCLLVRPEMRQQGFFDVLFEFKLVRRKELGKKGRELSELDDEALRGLAPVATALAEARDQAAGYRAALVRRFGAETLSLRCYAVVAVGLERILGEEVEDPRVDPASRAGQTVDAPSGSAGGRRRGDVW
jgi:hypothetical protein